MKGVVVTAGGVTRTFGGIVKIKTGGQTWIPQDEAAAYVQTEDLKATQNGAYIPTSGKYYGKVKVKVKKKNRKEYMGTAEATDPVPSTATVNISKIRTALGFPGVEKISAGGNNGETTAWVLENNAYCYVKTETLNATDNDTYEPSENAFFKAVTVNVTGEQEDDLDDNGMTAGTKQVAYSSVTVNVPTDSDLGLWDMPSNPRYDKSGNEIFVGTSYFRNGVHLANYNGIDFDGYSRVGVGSTKYSVEEIIKELKDAVKADILWRDDEIMKVGVEATMERLEIARW